MAQSVPAVPSRRSPGSPFALGLGAAALAAVLTHVRSLGAPFFADDWIFLDQARFRSLGQVLVSPDPLGNFFRPLGRQVWFWLLATAGGESPVAFHAANLLCLVASVVLVGVLARRVAGDLAGVVAASYLALHYAADVPVLWVSGSQELLSLVLVLGAFVLHQRGRAAGGAALYFLALLAKEVVMLAPLVALALDSRGGSWRERARRAWPFGVALLAWAALATWAMARRGTGAGGVSLTPTGPLAVPVLLARVALGLEWLTDAWPWTKLSAPGGASLIAVLVATGAVVALAPRRHAAAPGSPAPASRRSRAARGRGVGSAPTGAGTPNAPGEVVKPVRSVDPGAGIRAGVAWACAGALPVAVVAPVWSAYYFLFAIAGVALALGSLAASRRWPGALAAAVVAAAGLASTQARGLEEFATARSPWSGQSHVNRFYLERGMRVITRGLEDLRRQLPKPRPQTTFFFAGLPPFASFQVADGPLVRGAYRDSSLRGYYLSELTPARVARGPWAVFFYDQPSGRLVDRTSDPRVFLSAALGQILNERLELADAALAAAAAQDASDPGRLYLSALVAFARGDSARARELFLQGGDAVGTDAGAAVARARTQVAAGDSVGAVQTLRLALQQSMLSADAHSRLSDLLLARPETAPEGMVEAFAARVMDPGSGLAWRRWAIVLANQNRQSESIAALDRYFALVPAAAKADAMAIRLRALLVRMLPGGDIAQRSMKKELVR